MVRTKPTFLSFCFLVVAGCGGKAPTPPADAPVTPAVPIATTPEIDAKLAAADKKDGKEDKVVHKCAGCALHMDGDAKFALKVGGYDMHFCKDACLVRYQKDALGELGKLKVD
ncbi:MAG: hypothetical protein JNK15_17810 [Planctomycetes bacterium]|nr:hypothetical protein [Planctomycetota bacterium]